MIRTISDFDALNVYKFGQAYVNGSFRTGGIHHQILNSKGEVAAEADDVVVMYDFTANEKMPVPDDFRRKVEEMEGRSF